jgi:hypothetical protein
MEKADLVRLAGEALASAVANDADRTTAALDEIAETGDPFDMYCACCGFAETAKRAMVKLIGESPDLAAGDMWALQNLRPDLPDTEPAKTFARRFIVAYANDDKDTVPALYRAALDAGPEQFTESVCELLAETADLERHARAQPAQP